MDDNIKDAVRKLHLPLKIIDGKEIAERFKTLSRVIIEELKTPPGLAVILVGSDPASEVYVRNKNKDCTECGITVYQYNLPEYTDTEDLIELIEALNKDSKINGILVQLPLPKQISINAVISAIDPSKDVDCFNPTNLGKLYDGTAMITPCTPQGIMYLLNANVPLDGKHVVIVGRSNIVGKPLVNLLLERNATVTICHSHTKNLANITRQADVLIVAVGKAKFITENMVNESAVVIDVGINRDENGKLCGDVLFDDEMIDKVSQFTPVPGGVGPMTRAMLVFNLARLAAYQEEDK